MTTEPNSSILGIYYSSVKEIQFVQIKGIVLALPKVDIRDNISNLLQDHMIYFNRTASLDEAGGGRT